jgi:hypothetical protein
MLLFYYVIYFHINRGLENMIEMGIVQIYLPAEDIQTSVKWYVENLEFQIQFENSDFATLRHHLGPRLMLRKTSSDTPVRFMLNERVFPVLSLMYPDVQGLHKRLTEKNIAVGDITRFGEGNRYIHFHLDDPYGNRLDVGNYPDRDKLT